MYFPLNLSNFSNFLDLDLMVFLGKLFHLRTILTKSRGLGLNLPKFGDSIDSLGYVSQDTNTSVFMSPQPRAPCPGHSELPAVVS